METSTAIVLALMLCAALFVPFFIMNVRRGKAKGHTWFTWWKPQGHSDIGPEIGTDNAFRQTRPGADDARGARY
jgi:hypothetical protein